MAKAGVRCAGVRRGAAIGAALGGLLGLAACETPQQRIEAKEDHLAAAGFVVRPANTAGRQAMLNRLPPNKFIRRVHGDSVAYVYADPVVCDCLYVGDQQAYASYQRFLQREEIAEQQQSAALAYSDAAWDWGGWGFGPYGGGPFIGPGYGFGVGF